MRGFKKSGINIFKLRLVTKRKSTKQKFKLMPPLSIFALFNAKRLTIGLTVKRLCVLRAPSV